MQRIEIIGHIGNDAEIKDFNNNQVINFSVAVSENYTNKEGVKVSKTSWYECAKWGNQTQIAPYLKKGTQVFVSGAPTARSWVNSNGETIVRMGITVNNIQLLGSKNESTASGGGNANPVAQSEPINEASKEVDDESTDLPF